MRSTLLAFAMTALVAPVADSTARAQVQSKRGTTSQAETDQPTAAVPARWYSANYDGVLRLAAERNRPVLIYFWMDGSNHCARLWGETLAQPELAATLGQFVCFSANATATDGRALVQRYSISTLPTLLIADHNGVADDIVVGYQSQSLVQSTLTRIAAGQGTVTQLRVQASADPKDLQKRCALAIKLADVGDLRTARILFTSIRSEDPDGRTEAGARVLLRTVIEEIQQKASNPADPTTWDLATLTQRIAKVTNQEVLFQAHDWLATTEGQRSHPERVRDALLEAFEHLPKRAQATWPAVAMARLYEHRTILSKPQRKRLRGYLETAYLTDFERARQGQPVEDAAGYKSGRKLLALAQAWFLDGAVERARTATGLAVKLAPNDTELAALAAEIGRSKAQ